MPQTSALITSGDNSWPSPLPFHTALKIPQPNIFTHFYTYPCECECASLSERERERERESVCVSEWVCECVRVCVCLCKWVSVFVMMSHVDKAWIYSAQEFLELYGKVEAVVRNWLLRWSGHLVEVVGTRIFDQSFCFKHISLFCAAIGTFSAGL